MAFGLQVASMVAALIAAAFWFWSTQIPMPPFTATIIRGGRPEVPPYRIAQRRQNILNRLGAVAAIVSAVLSGLAVYMARGT